MTTDDIDQSAAPSGSAQDRSRAVDIERARSLADEAESKAKEVAALMARLARLLERDDAEP